MTAAETAQVMATAYNQLLPPHVPFVDSDGCLKVHAKLSDLVALSEAA